MLGLTIKAYMDSKGIKQIFLAEKTGMGLSVVNAVLNGNRKIEATEYFEICKALDVPLNYFFQEEIK